MAITPVGPGGTLPLGTGTSIAPAPAPAATQGGFDRVLGNLIDNVQGPQLAVDQAVRDLATGNADNVHKVMMAVAKAELSFKMLLEIRNRLTEAYQDIMRMQV
jgi:flagellar hook-basal body complex protein FliE